MSQSKDFTGYDDNDAAGSNSDSDNDGDDYDNGEDSQLENPKDGGNGEEKGSTEDKKEGEAKDTSAELKDKFNVKEFFNTLFPTFLFKWDGEIKMQPELDDLKAYCNKY
jgi:hypothetical protein